jgi:hypothetical protein
LRRLVFWGWNRERRLFEDAGGGSQDSRNRESGANPERSSPLCSEKTRFSAFVPWNRVFNFFPFANAFSENFRRFFASVRVAVIDALRQVGRRLFSPPSLVVSFKQTQRRQVFATFLIFRRDVKKIKRSAVRRRLFALRRPEKRIPLVRRPSRVFEVFLGEPQNRTFAATDGASIGSKPVILKSRSVFLAPTPTRPAI